MTPAQLEALPPHFIYRIRYPDGRIIIANSRQEVRDKIEVGCFLTAIITTDYPWRKRSGGAVSSRQQPGAAVAATDVLATTAVSSPA